MGVWFMGMMLGYDKFVLILANVQLQVFKAGYLMP